MALATSSLHLPTNIRPKDNAAIEANSTLSASTIKLINWSYNSTLAEPAYANPNPITAPILTYTSGLSN